MNSGTTETKQSYSRDEILLMLYHYQKKAAEDFNAANQRIAEKLAKQGIPLNEFTTYVIEQEKPKHDK